MRLNQYIAQATGMSRRAADEKIENGDVRVNNHIASLGQTIGPKDIVALGDMLLKPKTVTTIILNKPAGYVTSRDGQGSPTIYELLPRELHHLKPVGRLDKDSSGLLLLTNDGTLAQKLTHPKFHKQKIYRVTLDKPLVARDLLRLKQGVTLEDGPSKFENIEEIKHYTYEVTLREGRNRQVRRTFATLGVKVKTLQRTRMGGYSLNRLKPSEHRVL